MKWVYMEADGDTAMSACSGMMKAIKMATMIVIYNVRIMYKSVVDDIVLGLIEMSRKFVPDGTR